MTRRQRPHHNVLQKQEITQQLQGLRARLDSHIMDHEDRGVGLSLMTHRLLDCMLVEG